MKKCINWCLVISVAVMLWSCSSSKTGSLDYLPCKVEKGMDWGFVNNKGQVFLSNEFVNKPSNVREGLFSVYEGAGFSLYSFDKKKPKLLLENLKDVGEPNGGVLPVCKIDNHIEIVNLKGETILELKEFEGNEVVGCAHSFNEFGWLEVYTIDNNGETRKILIDKKGKVVFSAKNEYDAMYWNLIDKNLIFGFPATEEGEAVDGTIAYNLNNEIQKEWTRIINKPVMINYVNEYITTCETETDGRIYIWNQKGKPVMKCPDKVSSIVSINGKQFVFRSKDYLYGVMDFSGETVLSAKYRSVEILDNGYLVNKSGDRYEILNNKGEKECNLDWDEIVYVKGFGWLAVDGKDYYIVNDQFEALQKFELYDVDDVEFGSGDHLESEYFNMEGAVEKTIAALQKELQDKGFYFGNSIENIPVIKNAWIYSLPDFSTYTKVIAAGNQYMLTLTAHFDGAIVKREELNSNAKVDVISVTLSFPSNHKSAVKSKLQEKMGNVFTTSDNKTYSSQDYMYKMVTYYDRIEIVIRPICPVSEDEKLLNDIVDRMIEIFGEEL